jgi:hypothetical protein
MLPCPQGFNVVQKRYHRQNLRRGNIPRCAERVALLGDTLRLINKNNVNHIRLAQGFHLPALDFHLVALVVALEFRL